MRGILLLTCVCYFHLLRVCFKFRPPFAGCNQPQSHSLVIRFLFLRGARTDKGRKWKKITITKNEEKKNIDPLMRMMLRRECSYATTQRRPKKTATSPQRLGSMKDAPYKLPACASVLRACASRQLANVIIKSICGATQLVRANESPSRRAWRIVHDFFFVSLCV